MSNQDIPVKKIDRSNQFVKTNLSIRIFQQIIPFRADTRTGETPRHTHASIRNIYLHHKIPAMGGVGGGGKGRVVRKLQNIDTPFKPP